MLLLTILLILLKIIALLVALSAPLVFLLSKNIKAQQLILISPILGLVVLIQFALLFLVIGAPIDSLINFLKLYTLLFLVLITLALLLKKDILWQKVKGSWPTNTFPFWLTLTFIIVQLYILLGPLLSQNLLTTASFGNLDPASYCINAEILGNDYLSGISRLITQNDRWGSYLILTYLSGFLDLPCYQIFTLFNSLSFILLTISIMLLASVLSYKPNVLIPFYIFAFFGLNNTMLYLQYNGFIAQIVHMSFIPAFIVIFLNTLRSLQINFKQIIVLGLTFNASIITYPEGLLFLAIPILFIAILYLLEKHQARLRKLLKLSLIFITLSAINPFSLYTAIKVNLYQIHAIGNAGWPLPRKPWVSEMLGIQSVLEPKPPILIFLTINTILLLILLIGIKFSSPKKILTSFVVSGVFLLMIFWAAKHDSYSYYKITTIYIPYIVILFTIGIFNVARKVKESLPKQTYQILILPVLIIAGLYPFYISLDTVINPYSQTKYFVDRSLASLSGLNNLPNIAKILPLSQIQYNLWDEAWIKYFLPNKQLILPSKKDFLKENINLAKIPVLYRKTEDPYFNSLFPPGENLWESPYFTIKKFPAVVIFKEGWYDNENINNENIRWMSWSGEIEFYNDDLNKKQFCFNLSSYLSPRHLQVITNSSLTETILVPQEPKFATYCIPTEKESITRVVLKSQEDPVMNPNNFRHLSAKMSNLRLTD